MRKIISKIASLMLGLSLAAGVGVAFANHKSSETKATDITDTLTSANFVATNTTYKDFSGVSATSDAVYAGNSGKTSSGGIQLRSKNSNSGIVSTSSGGTVKSVTITVESGSNTVDVYGSNNAYTAASDLYNSSSQGTKVGSTSTTGTITFTDSYSYVGIRSNNGALYLTSVAIVWDDGQGGGGGTTTYTITYDANGGSGEMSSTTAANPSVAVCTFTAPEGKVFSTWNTEDDGSGDDYAAGTPVSADLDLYAIWVDKPLCVTLDKIGTSAPAAYSETLDTLDITDGSDTYTLNFVNGKKQNDAMIMQKSSGAFISNHTAIPGNITSLILYINSGASGSATYDVAFSASEITAATAGIGAVGITGGNSHEYTNSTVEDAKYFCITLGANYNGQVLKIVVNYEEGDAPDPTKKDMVIKQGGVAADGIELVYSSSSYAFKAFEESTELSDITWSVSDQTVATISAAGALSCVKPGSVVVYAEKEGYNKASASITITKGSVSTVVVSGSMTKTDYYVGDEWSIDGFTVTANYSSGLNEDVTSSAAWSYNPASPALNVESVVVTATFGGKSGSSSAQSVSVTRANPIQALYSKAKGASTGEFYGYYVGFATGSGPIVMDGAYGIMLYNSSQDVSSWTEGETILHISSGTIDIYNGLYEVKSYTVETVSSADVAKPIVHTTTGSESATDANRLTNATGVVAAAPTKGSFTGDPAASDIQFTFTVGSNTFTVYYKKAAQTSEVMAALADSLENHTELTLNGFTSWYNNFQLTMIGLVEAVESYTAEVFARDLLDQTDDVCAGYKDGDNNHDALEEIWSDLASKDKYPSLPTEQKNILAGAERDESGSVVEQAMARYDYLTGKYNLSNFINGRTPIVVAGATFVQSPANINSSTIIIVVVALTSITSIGVLLVIKRKRSLVK